jgi:hypothetical protein
MRERHVANTIREKHVSVSFENGPFEAEQKQEIQHEDKKRKKAAATEEKDKNAP